jgi:predicted dehydrogenase
MLKIGLIGAGRMGSLYGRIVNESGMGKIVALVGNTPTKTRQAAQTLDCAGYPQGDLDSLWQKHALDAVIVATPEWEHLRPSLQALERGLPLLLEKPMTDSWTDAQTLAQAVPQNHLIMLCHVSRFDPRFAHLREAVRAGKLGKVRHIYARRSADQATFARLAGRTHPAYWLTPHDVDLMRWMTGAEVVEVTAHGILDGTSHADGLFVDLRFADGTVGRIENTWTTQALQGIWRWGQFDLQGERGHADVTPSEGGYQLYSPDAPPDMPDMFYAPEIAGRIEGAFARLVHHFLRSVQHQTPPSITLADGLESLRVATAIKIALAEKRPVALSEVE